MGIIHVKCVWTKVKRRKPKTANGTKTREDTSLPRGKTKGLRLERNREGVFYFRQPIGHNKDVVTWHVYASGEPLLRSHKVNEGQVLPVGLFKQLYRGGHLYTGRGKHSSGATKSNRGAPQHDGLESGEAPRDGVTVVETAEGRILTVHRPPIPWLLGKDNAVGRKSKKKANQKSTRW